MNKFKLILSICIIILFMGCGVRQEKVEEGITDLSMFPQLYQQNGENVSFDTEIIIDCLENENKIYIGKAKLQQIHYQELQSLLMDDTNLEKYEDTLNNFFGDKYTSYFCKSKDGQTFSMGFHTASYTTSFCKYIDSSFRPLEEDEMYNGNLYLTGKDLPGFTKEEAFQLLKETLEKAHCQISDEYICYTLDHKIMRQEEYCVDLDGNEEISDKKDNWTEEDDCYYFALRQRVCGLPEFHPYHYQDMYDTVQSMPVQAIVSRRGIEQLSVERLFVYEMEKQAACLKPFEEIADSIQKNLSQVIGANSYLVTKAQLRYYEQLIGKDEYKVIPVWLISFQQESGGIIWNYLSLYDAITGKEITP